MRMMPDVHLRRVEDILERTQRQNDVRVIEVSDQRREDVHGKEVGRTKAEECKRHVQHRVVHNILHPVIAHVCGKAHLLHTVMQLMKLPQPR